MGTVPFMGVAELPVDLRVGLYNVGMVVRAKNLTPEHEGEIKYLFKTMEMHLKRIEREIWARSKTGCLGAPKPSTELKYPWRQGMWRNAIRRGKIMLE